MIASATGLPVGSRLSRAELQEHEIRRGLEQGPVPACLLPGYVTPPVVVRLPAPSSCAAPAPSSSPRRTSRPGHPSLPPQPAARPLDDPDHRRALVAAQLAGGAWKTVREIAVATGLHPEVVRTTLRSMRAVSRPVNGESKTRGAAIEFAAEGTAGAQPAEPRHRRSGPWTHAACEACAAVRRIVETRDGSATDLVCTGCGAVIATLFRGAPDVPAAETRRKG